MEAETSRIKAAVAMLEKVADLAKELPKSAREEGLSPGRQSGLRTLLLDHIGNAVQLLNYAAGGLSQEWATITESEQNAISVLVYLRDHFPLNIQESDAVTNAIRRLEGVPVKEEAK